MTALMRMKRYRCNGLLTVLNSTIPRDRLFYCDKASPMKHRGLSRQALLYMSLLALQFGVQPILTKRFTPPYVCRSSIVIVQESVKFVFAAFILLMSGKWSEAVSQWTLASWVQVAVLPAALYCVQNIAALYAYQNLDAITFNVLNQTKTLSAALCCFLIMGHRQSFVQVLALLILLVAALVLEDIIPLHLLSVNSRTLQELQNIQWLSSHHFTHGVAPILLASFLSGFNGAITQRSLQHNNHTQNSSANKGRNSYLYSMELCVASVLILVASLTVSDDGARISTLGFFHRWNYQTFIPILTNAMGGIVVGLVTKHAGSVQKGFALIFGILLSGILQQLLEDEKNTISRNQVISGSLAALSLWMHAAYPHRGQDCSTNMPKTDTATWTRIHTPTTTSPVRSIQTRRKTRKED